MYNKSKSSTVPSDTQAREKLAMYVYEYLLHVGANNAAHTFLKEIGWEKSISVGDPPGFLHSWWCVFWDLYCASPERRDTCEHSPEAKAYHDYSAATVPSPLNSMPPDGLCQGMPGGYFPTGSAASPSPHHNPSNPMSIRQSFMSPRYPPGGSRPSLQGHGPGGIIPGMDHPRAGLPGMPPMSRMMHPRAMAPGSIGPYGSGPDQYQQPYSGIRIPTNTSLPSHANMPMSMHHGGRSPWSNPGSSGAPTAGHPSTPIMRSPPDPINSDYGPMAGGKPMGNHPPIISQQHAMGNMSDPNIPASSMSIPMSAGGMPVSTSSLNGMNGSGGPDPAAMMDGGGMPKSSPSNTIPPMNSIAPRPMGPSGGPGGTPVAHTPQGESESGEPFNLVPSFQDNVSSNAPMASF